MEITQNQTNNTETPNINPPLGESWKTEEPMVPKRQFRLLHLSPRSLFVSILALLLLLASGLTAVAAVKNTFKKVFQPSPPKTLSQEEQVQQPTIAPKEPTTSPGAQFTHLPAICQKEPESLQCEQEFKALLDRECGGDIDAPTCSEIKKEALAFAQQDECQKDPNSPKCKCLKSGNLDSPECNSPELINQAFISQLQEDCQKDPSSSICNCINDADPPRCFGKALIGESLGQAFCEIAKYEPPGSVFSSLCQKFGVPTSESTSSFPSSPAGCQLNPYAIGCQEFFESTCSFDPYAPGCEEYVETVCLDDPYAFGCENYCLQNPESPICLQRCQDDLELPGCQELLEDYCQFYPYEPGCDQYFELTCAQDPYQTGCIEHCYQNPYTEGCLAFLAQYCRDNLLDSICMDVLCDRAPQFCAFCQQFPNVCEQVLQRYLGL